MFCSSTPTRFVPFATFAGKPEQDQHRQRQQRAAAGERIDEAAAKTPMTGTAASSSVWWSMRSRCGRRRGAAL